MIPKVIVENNNHLSLIKIDFSPDISTWIFPKENSNQFINMISNIVIGKYKYLLADRQNLAAIKADVVRIMCHWISDGSVIVNSHELP